MTQILPAEISEMDAVRAIFKEYEAFLGVDLCFQGFAKELEDLPGIYAEPSGSILLAKSEGKIAGVVALKPLKTEGTCEMKRLYVRPEFQKMGIGRQLSERIMAIAKDKGYKIMYLDTLNRLKAAVKLYESLDFEEIEPYNVNPEADVRYFAKVL